MYVKKCEVDFKQMLKFEYAFFEIKQFFKQVSYRRLLNKKTSK